MACTYEGKTYSEGSLLCANGRELKCRGDSWAETGFDCKCPDHQADIFPTITDDERREYDGSFDEKSRVKGWNRVFVDHWSVREDGSFYYFKAALSQSHVCSNFMTQNYQVPKPDVIFGPATMCPPGGTFFRETQYFWPG